MDIVFILVAPARPANVGAAARALKTMGFNHWRLVASSAHLAPEAGYVAHGAGELLQQVECFDTVAEAIADCDLVVATTARRERVSRSGTATGSAFLGGGEDAGTCAMPLPGADSGPD